MGFRSSLVGRNLFKHGRKIWDNPYGKIDRYTINISEWTEFEFNYLCWYWEDQTDNIKGEIGRLIGVSHQVGSALCYWVLTGKKNITARTTVQHVTRDEAEKPKIQQSIRNYHMTL